MRDGNDAHGYYVPEQQDSGFVSCDIEHLHPQLGFCPRAELQPPHWVAGVAHRPGGELVRGDIVENSHRNGVERVVVEPHFTDPGRHLFFVRSNINAI